MSKAKPNVINDQLRRLLKDKELLRKLRENPAMARDVIAQLNGIRVSKAEKMDSYLASGKGQAQLAGLSEEKRGKVDERLAREKSIDRATEQNAFMKTQGADYSDVAQYFITRVGRVPKHEEITSLLKLGSGKKVRETIDAMPEAIDRRAKFDAGELEIANAAPARSLGQPRLRCPGTTRNSWDGIPKQAKCSGRRKRIRAGSSRRTSTRARTCSARS